MAREAPRDRVPGALSSSAVGKINRGIAVTARAFAARCLFVSLSCGIAAAAHAQVLNPQALSTVSAATCRLDRSDLGWSTGMAMTPYAWGRHPAMKKSQYHSGFIADPMHGAVLIYQIAAGEEVMQGVREGMAGRESVLKYITFNYHTKEKLVLGKDLGDRGMPRLYAVTGTQGDMKSYGYAGYAKGYLVYFIFSSDPKQPFDGTWLDRVFTTWLARFPNVEGAEALAVRVVPSMADSASEVGLIPATDQLPALLRVQGLGPDASLTVTIPGSAAAELRGGGTAGATVTLKADGGGRAEVQLFAKSTERAPKPYAVRVHIQSSDGKSLDATVHVGLAISFSDIEAIKGNELNKVRAPYPLLIGVTSRAHPDINLARYIERAEKSGAWGPLTLGVDLKTEWLNQPSDGPDDRAYWGTTSVYFHGQVKGNTILSANGEPNYRVESFTYPSVVLSSGGAHLYRVSGFPVVMRVADKSSAATARQGTPSREPWLANERVVVLAGNDPDGWFNFFQAGACALEPTSTEQEIYLGLLKTFPATAALTGDITGAAAIACNFAKGEYASAFLDFGKMLGTKYIERLAAPETFKTLTPREQQMVRAGKLLTDEVDKAEKDDEREKLKANVKKQFDEQMKALYPK